MLERIESIKRIGLFNDADGRRFRLGPNALIYADNGRGKSTLSALLHSLSTGDSTLLHGRKTLDGSGDMSASLLLSHGLHVKFTSDQGWDATRAEFLVFDTAFIDRNVHSGGEVTPKHRERFLTFALGTSAVAAQQAVEAARQAVSTAKESVAAATQQITAHRSDLSLGEFRTLAHDPSIDAKIIDLEARVVATRDAAKILSRAIPPEIQFPIPEVDELLDALETTLQDVHDQAGQLVRAHLEGMRNQAAESWVREGLQHDDSETCPYCGQGTDGVALLQAYRTHFDAGYTQLADRIAAMRLHVENTTGAAALQRFTSTVDQANQMSEQWNAHCAIQRLEVDQPALESALLKLNLHCLNLLDMKAKDIGANTVTTSDRNELAEEARVLLDSVQSVNSVLRSNADSINAFKATLTSTSLDDLGAALVRLKLVKSRHSTAVGASLQSLASAEAAVKSAEASQKAARDRLTSVMTSTLGTYKTAINHHLTSLGAAFTIDVIETNYLGGSTKSDYAIKMRGRSLKASNGQPPLSMALSDGDKRTLAFAFFAASVMSNPDIGSKVVVVDDPVSSLDRSRREATSHILQGISERAHQLIVLTHDANLVRELRNRFVKDRQQSDTTVHRLARTANDYTTFDDVDIDAECETDYFRNYRLVTEHVMSAPTDTRRAAEALRPLLEGHLNRRYPGAFSSMTTLGSMITAIAAAVTPSPLTHAQHLVPDMREINSYASEFHHDSNPGSYRSKAADDAVVKNFGARILSIIHGAVGVAP